MTSKTTTMADTIEKSHRFRLDFFFIFPLILVRLAWGLKQIPRKKNDSNMPNVRDFQTKILLKSHWRTTENVRLLVNNFLTRSLKVTI